MGAGGHSPPWRSSVITHHAIRITTMTVVICMILNASSLDSCSPLVFRRQKYAVIAIANNAAVKLIGTCTADPSRSRTSLISPAIYWPAETPLIGPVRT